MRSFRALLVSLRALSSSSCSLHTSLSLSLSLCPCFFNHCELSLSVSRFWWCGRWLALSIDHAGVCVCGRLSDFLSTTMGSLISFRSMCEVFGCFRRRRRNDGWGVVACSRRCTNARFRHHHRWHWRCCEGGESPGNNGQAMCRAPNTKMPSMTFASVGSSAVPFLR